MIPIKPGMVFFIIALCLSCTAVPQEPAPRDPDGPAESPGPETAVVAMVNGQPISRGAYQQSLIVLRDRLERKENSIEDYLNAKFDVLENLIANELLFQESERQGVAISESEIWGELERISEKRGGVDSFFEWMGTFGLTQEQSIESVRKRLSVDKYIEETITRRIQADESAVRSYYEENLERFKEPINARVSQILIRCDRDATPDRVEERRRRAEEILDNLHGGGVFSLLAREFSEDRSAALDGDIGFITKGSTFPELEAAAFELEAGELGGVVRTDAGFHILMVTERRGGDVPEYEAVEDVCRRAVITEKRNSAVRAAIERLRETAELESYLN